MSAFHPASRMVNGTVRSVSRWRWMGWAAVALLLAGITAGMLAWQGRQHYWETLSLLNQHGRAEEDFSWPGPLFRRAGIPVPGWFPREISFADNGDEHIDEFLSAAGKCRTLRGLTISGDALRDEHFLPLGQLTQLREIEITFSDHFTGIGFRHLPRHNSLVKIVTETTGITDQGVAQLVRFPELRELDLVECQMTDEGLASLAQLPKLECLMLSSPHLTSGGLAVLAECESLRYLGILLDSPAEENTDPITAEAVAELQQHMPSCRCTLDGQTWK